jgi:hypothetical protein
MRRKTSAARHSDWPSQNHSSMKSILPIVACALFIGCSPPKRVSKATHIAQVQRAIVKAGGETNVVNESRTLFDRLSREDGSAPFYTLENRCFAGLSGMSNLGDVFYYEPESIHVRIHNSHFDTYFIDLINPDRPIPAGFERIAGNVGFIEPVGAANQSQPIRSETNRASPAAGSGG